MKTNETKLLQGIDTVIVWVSNIDNSKDWYTEKLGLSIVLEDAYMKLIVLDTKGPTSLTLWQTEHAITVNRHIASYPIFKTTNALELRQELVSRGIHAEELVQDDYVKYFFFFDTDGNVLEACEVLA